MRQRSRARVATSYGSLEKWCRVVEIGVVPQAGRSSSDITSGALDVEPIC